MIEFLNDYSAYILMALWVIVPAWVCIAYHRHEGKKTKRADEIIKDFNSRKGK